MVLQPNTFMGGVSSVIPNKEELARILGISSSAIPIFLVVGENVEANITANYDLLWRFEPGVPEAATYFADYGGKCTQDHGYANFFKMKWVYHSADIILNLSYFSVSTVGFPVLEKIDLPAVTAAVSGEFNVNANSVLNHLYIPNITALGVDATNNNVFGSSVFPSGCRVYVHPSLETNNAGSPDGDIAFIISKGAYVRYVSNSLKPNIVTGLTIDNIYKTAVDLSWNASSGSNGVDYYLIYVDGVLKTTSESLSAQLIGLTSGATYEFTVFAVDNFYNKSDVSVGISTQINGTTDWWVPLIVSGYKLENNVLDSVGINDGTPTDITYAAGKVGQSAVFNGTTSIMKANSLDFDFYGTAPLSISCVINLLSLPAYGKTFDIAGVRELNTAGTTDKVVRVYSDGSVGFYVYDGAQRVAKSAVGKIAINTDYVLVGTYDGAKLGIYIGETLEGTSAASGTFNFSSPTFCLSNISGNIVGTNGKISEAHIWGVKLTPEYVSDIFTRLNSGQSLI